MRRMMLVGMIVTATMLITASGSWAWTQVIVTRGYQGGPGNVSHGWNVNQGGYPGAYYGWGQGVDERIMRQEALIHHGVATRQITPYEERMLERNLDRIRATKAHLWSDGRLSQPEREVLDRMLDRNRAMITQASHDYDGYGRYNR